MLCTVKHIVFIFLFFFICRVFFIEKFGFSPAQARAVNRYCRSRSCSAVCGVGAGHVSLFISIDNMLTFMPFSVFLSIVYIISAPASPVLGFIVDRTGRNVLWVLIAVAATLAAHMMLAFTFWNPWIAMVTTRATFNTELKLFAHSERENDSMAQ